MQLVSLVCLVLSLSPPRRLLQAPTAPAALSGRTPAIAASEALRDDAGGDFYEVTVQRPLGLQLRDKVRIVRPPPSDGPSLGGPARPGRAHPVPLASGPRAPSLPPFCLASTWRLPPPSPLRRSTSLADLLPWLGARAQEGVGAVVSMVYDGGNAASSGIREGDVVVATSASIGPGMWPKATVDGIESAIKTRVDGNVRLRLRREQPSRRPWPWQASLGSEGSPRGCR